MLNFMEINVNIYSFMLYLINIISNDKLYKSLSIYLAYYSIKNNSYIFDTKKYIKYSIFECKNWVSEQTNTIITLLQIEMINFLSPSV